MRSRALPEDFDMTQALHSPFGGSHGISTPLSPPVTYTPVFPEGNMIRPLSIDTLRRVPDGTHMSPTGISPAFGGFAFTPPQSATDALSPVSGGADASPFSYSPVPLDGGPRRPNPFIGSPTSTPGFTSHPHIPRLQMHSDRVVRTRAESLSSPLRTSMTYGHEMNCSHEPSATSLESVGGTNSTLHYGLGYSCKAPTQG